MSDIRFRIAKPSDARQIADCHWHVRDRYSTGIFLSLNKKFLEVYYKITLDDPTEVVVCAERDDGVIAGFCSATIDSARHSNNLKNHKLRLGLAALGAILKRPKLLKELWARYRSLDGSDDGNQKFVCNNGVRGEYWCWRKDIEENTFMSVDMANIRDGILYALGNTDCFFEVDTFNKSVYRYHEKVEKAEPMETVVLPDGRERVLFRKKLMPYKKYGIIKFDD